MENFKKVVHLGKGERGQIYVTIEVKNNNLSISGVEGPQHNGDCKGSCGQIRETIHNQLNDIAKNLPRADIEKLLAYWEMYHLNDLQPGCEHQRALGWSSKRIDESKPANTYGKHFVGQEISSKNSLGWVYEKEHPNGLLAKPCPICSYQYGTKWLRMEIPEDALQWLSNLPSDNVQIGTWFK